MAGTQTMWTGTWARFHLDITGTPTLPKTPSVAKKNGVSRTILDLPVVYSVSIPGAYK